jgi:oxaloacetate decarboxylase gamma subunit
MQQTLMVQGFDLMLYGMGAVYVFLTLLVVLTGLMSWFVNRYLPESLPSLPVVALPSSPAGPVDPKVITVIQDAISQHRAKQSQ